MNAALDKYVGLGKRHKAALSMGILILFYVSGTIGLNTSYSDWFLAATPLTLLVSIGILLLNHEDWNLNFGLAALAAMSVGFFIEVAGVATGLVFGSYWYGETLGPKLLDVPLTISLNWLLLVYCTGVITAATAWPKFLKAAVGALLMTGLDVLIEPVAMRSDFWHWEGNVVPFQNYLVWFLTAFALLLLFHFLPFKKRNKVAFGLFILQVAFFGILNLI